MTSPRKPRTVLPTRAASPVRSARAPRAGGQSKSKGNRRVGRPSRIDRAVVAEAVLEIGLGKASMKAVANHLGVSVPGLYHHVRNRKELLLLAAEYSMARNRPPADRGQPWWEWLREWGRYSYDAFVDQPEVFLQYLNGAISWDVTVDVIDSVIGVLTREGFGPREALAAFNAVGRLAIGCAVDEIRRNAAAEDGRPLLAELHRVLAARGDEALPGVQKVIGVFDSGTSDDFEEDLNALLSGIALRRGEPSDRVIASQSRTGKLE